MNVSDIMVRDVISIEPDDTVAKAISLMVENKIHQLPVVARNLYKGMVYVKKLIEVGVFPRTTKVQTVTVNTASLEPDMEIWEANQAIMGSGLRAVPVLMKDKLVGIVSETDLAMVSDIGSALVDDVMKGAIVVQEDSTVSYALSNMKKQNISRLPVVSKNSKLVGVLDTLDIIQVLGVPRERMSGSRTTTLSARTDRVDFKSVKVGEIMGKASSTKMGTRLSDAVKLLKRAEEIIVIDNDMPAGIIAPKDVIKFSMPEQRGPVVQIAHVDDEGVKQEIMTEVNKFLKRIAGRFDSVYSFEVSVDRHRTRKYSMHGKLMTTDGLISARSTGWDVRSASKELVTRMDRRIGDYKPDRRRGPTKVR
ncbi:MAG TPA: CBS domain-containing protein [Nitrososphaerales archaeon]|jgi:CBS domain-containing protein|nr:CBS domain-containing protein [Nitrososphaerales archaeon]